MNNASKQKGRPRGSPLRSPELLSAAEIRVILASQLPFYEREDKDDFHYLATASDIFRVSMVLYDAMKSKADNAEVTDGRGDRSLQ